MSLRICFVTPFAWSQPHEVNAHVDGTAKALRARGHDVTILAPSSRGRDLLAGRRALQRGADAEVIAVGPSIPLSRRTNMGVPVAVRANLRLALTKGRFDVVHGFEPGLPSLSYLALTSTSALTAATFFSIDRLVYPARRSRRDRLRARVDALLATSQVTAEAASERFEGEYRLVPLGVDIATFHAGVKKDVIALELEPSGRSTTRALLRLLHDLPDWEAVLLHTKPLGFRPAVPRAVRGRVRVRAVRSTQQRIDALSAAAIFAAAPGGEERLALEAAASGAAIVGAAPATDVADAVDRLARDADAAVGGGRQCARARREAELRRGRRRARRALRRADAEATPARQRGRGPARRPRLDHDRPAHAHGLVARLLDSGRGARGSREASGLGGIAVTDHNVFGGALEAAELASDRDLIVIRGEEVKTDNQGEVIGLFLEEEIPRGMTFAETLAAIREQGGLVYVPHPFDRMHSIPDPATLHRHLAEIDVLEVYNARLLRDSFNDEALRFARKYRLLQGAGSDSHVLQGLGTGAVRMRRFDGPEEFLLSLRTAEILRRPKSLAYLQSLKWVAQVKERVL